LAFGNLPFLESKSLKTEESIDRGVQQLGTSFAFSHLCIEKTRKGFEMGVRHEIPRKKWEMFFQEFSRDHQEWSVDVEGNGRGSGGSQGAQGLPFEALTFHLDHTHEVLSIVVRKDDMTKGHVYKSITRPNRVTIEETGSDVKLHIDSADGSSTTVRFRRVATPDYDLAAKGGVLGDIRT
jgi:hypothetical protein